MILSKENTASDKFHVNNISPPPENNSSKLSEPLLLFVTYETETNRKVKI